MQPFTELIAGHLRRHNVSPIREALNAGLNRDAIRSVLRGRVPSVDRAAEICDALGLEFYVGPPRIEAPDDIIVGMAPTTLRDLERSTQSLARLTADMGGEPTPDDLWPVLAARRGISSPAPGNEDARPVSVVELAAAAGGSAESLGDEAVGHVWFRRDWLDRHGLDPTQCAVIAVRGESMEPTLPHGCSILIDRTRRRRLNGRIFVVQTGDGVIVKRLEHDADGRWQNFSDHPSWEPAPWPGDAETIGQVVWTARMIGAARAGE